MVEISWKGEQVYNSNYADALPGKLSEFGVQSTRYQLQRSGKEVYMRNNKRAGVEQGTPCLLVPAEELRAQKDYGDYEGDV